MSNCKKCNKYFPIKLYIDGKQRDLSNRIYCLDCSPFNLHNTKQLEQDNKETDCKCLTCGKSYIYSRSKGHTKTRCNSCQSNRTKYQRKEKLVNLKGGKCERCGYNKCLRALSFHHREGENKIFKISGNHTRSMEKVIQEINKCTLLCANCHMEIHNDGALA